MKTHHWLLVMSLVGCRAESVAPVAKPDPVSSVLTIDLDKLPSYAPVYPAHYTPGVLNTDNTPADNPVTDIGATLGRVLFYDKQLSVNGTVSCASCHSQGAGFSDIRVKSVGFEGGLTDVHSMRLTNTRFYAASTMFWDKRAANLEAQTTQPIQNPVEMGFDTAHGGMGAVVARLENLDYYPPLFLAAFGSPVITEQRIQRALAQFVRSMVSVNSAFDTGLASVGGNLGADFPNYTIQQNLGKRLFLTPASPASTGAAGCASCHVPPTFALSAGSRGNGLDLNQTTVFKSPSLKSVALDGAFMHDGRFSTLHQVVRHYNTGIQAGPSLDNRLRGAPGPDGSQPLRLNLSEAQIDALVAFMQTLTDEPLRTDPKFSDPFIRD
jgi:cytochrome c peroxidase